MATHHGKNGVVKVGSNAVAEVDEFSFSTSAKLEDDTSMTDNWDTFLVGRKSWQGSLTCHWDETDTNGQEALTEGASVTLNLYPEGSVSTDTYYTGNALITQVQYSVSKNGVVQRSFQFTGNGALTKATVA